MFKFFNKINVLDNRKYVSKEIQDALLYSLINKPCDWFVIKHNGGRRYREYWSMRHDILNIEIVQSGRFINPGDTSIPFWEYYYVNNKIQDIVNVIIENYKISCNLNKKIIEENIRTINTIEILNHIYGKRPGS